MNSLTLKNAAAAIAVTLALCTASAALAAPFSSSAANVPQKGVKPTNGETNISARAVVGQDVQSKTKQDLGEVKNLIVDTHSGRVLFATITQGGFFGLGETVHAVPYQLLQVPERGHATITINTDKATLDSSPKVPEDDPAWFVDHGHEVAQLFGVDWSPATSNKAEETRRLMTADQISGKDVVKDGRNVGTIKDVIINKGNQQSAALLDPNDAFAGTNQNFLVAFSQLTRGPKGSFSTTLQRADFINAAPSSANHWTADARYPYVWGAPAASGYAVGGMGYSGVNSTATNVTARAPVSDIRDALHNDPAIDQAVGKLSFHKNGDTLVVRGAVASSDLKDRIDHKLHSVARGWKVDNELNVRSASE